MEADYKRREKTLAWLIQRIEKSDKIVDENKKEIYKFQTNLNAHGLATGTILLRLYNLYDLALLVDNPFRKLNKEDIIKLLEKVNKKGWSDSHKRDFKITLRLFFKWLRGIEKKGEYPEEVEWIELNKKSKKNLLPEGLLTREEVEKLAESTKNLKYKSLILILYESGCRIGELLTLKIKNVQFDNYGAVLLVNGKTGQRRIRIMDYTKDLIMWLDTHPKKDNPEAYVWPSQKNKDWPLTYNAVVDMLVRIKNKTGITKSVSLHNFRHARATELASKVSEAIMKEHFGWTQDSRMTAVYYHLSGKDVDNALLKAKGIKAEIEETEPISTRVCSNCGEINTVLSHFCHRCNSFLDLSLAWKEKDEVVAKVIEKLKEDPEVVKKIRQIVKKLGLEKKFEE